MVDYLLCADWSKEQKGRALFVAYVRTREVRRVREFPLTVETTLARAREFAKKGNVLLSFDVPLGLPHSFFSAIRNVPGWEAVSSFTSFLPLAARTPTFFVSCTEASRWSLQQPFFAVPSVTGGKTAFERASAQIGVQLRRRIDVKAGGNPMFITAGIVCLCPNCDRRELPQGNLRLCPLRRRCGSPLSHEAIKNSRRNATRGHRIPSIAAVDRK